MTDRDRRTFLAGMAVSALATTGARAQGGRQMTRIEFETTAYTGAITGSGAPARWELLADPTAPTKAKVLAQTSTPIVDQRQDNQRARIRDGVKSGELTKREAARLRAEQRGISAEKQMAKADGVVTPAERAGLRRDQNRASRDIARQKHDTQKRP